MSAKSDVKKWRWAVWLAYGAVGLAVVIVLIVLLAWMNRARIAENFLVSECAARSLSCSAEFETLGFDAVRLANVRVESGGETPIEAQQVELALNWPAFLEPELISVNVVRPVLRATFLDGEAGAYGLEDALAPFLEEDDDAPDAPPAVLPEIGIEGGRIVLATDAGSLSGRFEMSGVPLQSGTVSVQMEPVELEEDGARLSLASAVLDLMFRDGTITGDVDISVGGALLGPVTLASGELKGQFSDAGEETTVSLAGEIVEFASVQASTEGIGFNLFGRFSRIATYDLDGVVQALNALTVQASSRPSLIGPAQIAEGELSLDLAADEGRLSGPAALRLVGVESEAGAADALIATGDVKMDMAGAAAYHYVGSLIAEGAALGPDMRRGLLESVALPEPLDAHGQRLKAGLSSALAGFDTGFELDARYEGEDWSVEAYRATLLRADSGLEFGLDPFANQPWLRARAGDVTLAGGISLTGGAGIPEIQGAIDELKVSQAGFGLQARSLVVKRWEAAGRALSARFESLDLGLGDDLRFVANGEVGIAGVLPGLVFGETRLIGHVAAVQAVEGLRVQTQNGSCVGFSTEGLEAGSVKLEPLALSLCPVDGRFVRQEGPRSVGRIDLGDVRWPFAIDTIRGRLELDEVELEWFTGDGFALFLNSRRFGLPLDLSGESFSIGGEEANMTIGLGGGPPTITTTLAATEFAGTLVPANVVAQHFSFSGIAGDNGVEGRLEADDVAISDLNEIPIYAPMTANLSAVIERGVLQLTAGVDSADIERRLADVSARLNIEELNGDAHVVLQPVEFAVNGLQPADLSELLRGVLTNARGGVSGEADFRIRDGAVSGSGFVDLNALGFDTLQVGSITGVNGRINFTDLLAMTTAPKQRLTVDFIDPGVPLADGVIDFQLVDGRELALDRVAWPFAGGRIVVDPTLWRLGNPEALELVVHAEELTLERLVDVFQVPDLVATGTVSGTFPVFVEGANLIVRDASLEADASGGKLAYTGTAVDAVKGQNIITDYAVDALKDLDFTVMKIGANGNLIGNIIVNAELLGKSDDVLDGAEFQFGVSLDSNLSKLLRTASAAAGETYISDALALEAEATLGSGEPEE